MKTIITISMLCCIFAGLPLYSENSDTVTKTDVEVIKTEIKNLNEKIDNGFNGIKKDFDRLYTILAVCIGIPMTILGIVWGILAYRRDAKNESLQKQIDRLSQVVETQAEQLKEMLQ